MTATQPHAVGVPGYSETWPCELESAGRARGLVRAALNTWGLGQLVGDGTLIVSELVGNAAQHSGSHLVRVSVTLVSPSRVRLGVTDKSTTPPEMHHPPLTAIEGRGLLVVDGVAEQWGTDIRRWGKVVWAELSVSKGQL
ncbi:ATP-binding protein [Streptomyces sp. NPDC048644]|uniref:ATP-binding protein n=1 Tax=Streptomyces sp. NPDC048644 TaxID=3365582 RepID=UPI0037178FCF